MGRPSGPMLWFQIPATWAESIGPEGPAAKAENRMPEDCLAASLGFAHPARSRHFTFAS
ncbi:DUF6053 domain-containing protein [Lysobacter enzymogenes]|uniref:DUF6053 domain-containing protein n=1 Tax=Lysobacter enzymogenes TaxID=69 RepID=UPI003749B006